MKLDLTTHCALCGAKLPCFGFGRPDWDQDPPLAQYTSGRTDRLCNCTGRTKNERS